MNEVRKGLILVCGLLTSTCAHVNEVQVSLGDALALNLELQTVAMAPATESELRFQLRNVGRTPVEICQVEAGVTVVVTLKEGGVVPLIGYGAVLDAGCYKRGTLTPGAVRVFEERVKLPPNTEALRGLIRVTTPKGDDSVAVWSRTVPVKTRPAG